MATLLDQSNAQALQFISNVKVLLQACQSGPAICAIKPAQVIGSSMAWPAVGP